MEGPFRDRERAVATAAMFLQDVLNVRDRELTK
jgi:hypothetical protein